MPASTAEKPTVAKKKAGRPKGVDNRGPGKTVRIDPDLYAKARTVAVRRNLELGPYLSELLEGPVNRDYVAVLRELSELEARGARGR
jgi:hypothetical protein